MSLISSSQASTSDTAPSESAVPSISTSSNSNTATLTSTSANSRPSASPSSTPSSSKMSSSSTDSSSAAPSSPSGSDNGSSTSSSSASSSTNSPPPTTSSSSSSQSTSAISSSSPSSISTPPPPPPSSTNTSTTSSPSPPPSTSTNSSSTESQPPPTTSSSSPSTSASPIPSDSSSTLPTRSSSSDTSMTSFPSSSSVTINTITSTIVTTVDGQLSTITTTFPSTVSLNTPASGSSSHAGVIIGSAIGGTLGALLLLGGIFLLYRRGFRQKAAFSPVPTAPRSPPLHEQDFDLEGHSRQPPLPTLLPPRGSESGSIFREEVWPPPNTGSRLQDPLLAASHVDLTSIVDAVMGPSHPRWSSADTSASSEPLLGRDTPEGHSLRPSTSGSNQMGLGPQNLTNSMDTNAVGNQQPVMNADSSQQPVMSAQPSAGQLTTTGEANLLPERPLSLSNSTGPQNPFSLPPGAAPPFTPFLSRPVNRQRRRGDSIQSSGSPPPTEQRADRTSFGPLMVINDTPGDQDMPLVDLSPIKRESGVDIPRDQPPLYHTLPDLLTEPLQPIKRGEGSSSAQ